MKRNNYGFIGLGLIGGSLAKIPEKEGSFLPDLRLYQNQTYLPYGP